MKQDYAQAHAWYLRAAGHGNSDAENQLGFFAEEGWDQPKNYAEALAWFYKAAEHGSNDAEENIGYMFQNGLGVQTDYAKAMSWYVEAAAHGNSNAGNELGWLYQFGQGVKPDDARAVTWYRMSADLGNRRGAINLDALKMCSRFAAREIGTPPAPPSPILPSRGLSPIVWLRAIRAAMITMLRSRGVSPGRFHNSARAPCSYSSRAGATIVMSFCVCIGFFLPSFACSF